MSVKIASLYAEIGAKTDKFEKGAKKVKGDLSSLKSQFSSLAPASLVGFASLGGAIAGLATIIHKSTLAASDLAESISKVDVVFGDSANAVQEWSKTTADSIFISRQQALEAAGTYGNLFTALGLTEDAAADMSIEMVNLAADLASFNNLSPEQTLDALRSGLTGEVEPLKRLGVAMNQTVLAQKAMEMGWGDNVQALTEAQKIQLRYAVILEQTTTAQGDAERTAGGLANSTRRLDANLKDLSAAFGEAFVPAATEATNVMADFSGTLADGINKNNDIIQALRETNPALLRQYAITHNLTDEMKSLVSEYYDSERAAGAAASGAEEVSPAFDEAAQSSKALEDALKAQSDEYKAILSNMFTIQSAQDSWLKTENDNATRLAEIQEEKVRLQIEQNAVQAAGNLTLAERNKFMTKQIELDNEYNSIVEDSANALEEREKAEKKLVYNMLEHRAAADGLISSDEVRFLQDTAVTMGLIDRESADAAITAAETADTMWAGFEKVNPTMKNTRDLMDDIASHDGQVVQFGVQFSTYGGIPTPSFVGGSFTQPNQYEGGAGFLGRHQSGGSFIVPGAGVGDRPFMLGLSPGEQVDITPAGESRGGNTIIINATVNGEQDWDYVAQKVNERLTV